MFYSTGETNELVRTLGLSDKTPPGLPGLKPSSNSVLPVGWITRPARDLWQLVIDICGIDIRGLEYLRHPFHYPNAALKSNFTSKYGIIEALYSRYYITRNQCFDWAISFGSRVVFTKYQKFVSSHLTYHTQINPMPVNLARTESAEI